MRELAHIQLRGNDADFSSAWNLTNPVHRIEYGVVAIYRDHPEYERLLVMFNRTESPRSFEWHERIDVEYSDDELSASELLQFTVIGNAGEGGNEYADAYELRPLRSGCGLTEYIQVADLTINSKEFSAVPDSRERRRCDLFRTSFGEFIVSRDFQELARNLVIPGISFRSVYDLANSGRVSDAYFQLVAEAEIGPFLQPSPIERSGFHPECGAYESVLMTKLPKSLGSEFYFQRNSYHGEPLARSREKLGNLPQQTPLLFISGNIHTVLRKTAMRGYWAQPAHLVDA